MLHSIFERSKILPILVILLLVPFLTEARAATITATKGVFTNLSSHSAKFGTIQGSFTGTSSGSFAGTFAGNVTGNVTGNVSGDLTGNVAGILNGNRIDSTLFSTLPAALASSSTTGKTLVISTGYTLTSNLTIPSGKNLEFLDGGYINTNGYTLTFQAGSTLSFLGEHAIFPGEGTVVLAPSTLREILPTLFGAVGDGATDDTIAITKSISAARSASGVLHFTYGASGTYVYSPSTTIDLTGIQRIKADNVTLDARAASSATMFTVAGTKTLLGSGLTIPMNAEGITLSSVAGLNKGDTILIMSNQTHPNHNVTYYRYFNQGTRTKIDYVNTSTRKVYVFPNVDWSYTGAYVYKINPAKIVIENGLKINWKEESPGIGIQVSYAEADIGNEWNNFGNAAVLYRASSGTFTGRTNDDYYVGTGNSYGVSIADLSSVAVVGAHCRGARHAIASGGGGFFDGSDYGGTPGSTVYAFPAEFTVSGGFYASSRTAADINTTPSSGQGAIDAHGIAKSATVTGATIYGGVSLGALTNTVSGNTIHYSAEPGYTAKDTYTTTYTTHNIVGNTFIKDIPSQDGTTDSSKITQQIFVMDSVFSANKVILKNNVMVNNLTDTISGTGDNTDSLASVNGRVLNLDISGNYLETSNAVSFAVRFYISVIDPNMRLNISNNFLRNAGFYIQCMSIPSTSAVIANISGNYGQGTTKNIALYFNKTMGAAVDGREIFHAIIKNNTFIGYDEAIQAFTGVKYVTLMNNNFHNCVTATYPGCVNFYAWGSGSVVGVKRLVAYDNDFFSTNGVQQRSISFNGSGSGDSVKVYWRGNHATGSIGSPAGSNYAYFNTGVGITVIDEGHNDLGSLE